MSKSSNFSLLEASSRSIVRKRALLRMARVNCNEFISTKTIAYLPRFGIIK